MRANRAPKTPTLPNQAVLHIPGRAHLNEADCEVYCDEAFLPACKLAVGSVDALKAHVLSEVNAYLDSGKPVRERKPRALYEATF